MLFGEVRRRFFRKAISIWSSRISRSCSLSRARSSTVNSGSSPACARRYAFTQFAKVSASIPSSFAACEIGREASITSFTASSRYSGEKFLFGRAKSLLSGPPRRSGVAVRNLRVASSLEGVWPLKDAECGCSCPGRLMWSGCAGVGGARWGVRSRGRACFVAVLLSHPTMGGHVRSWSGDREVSIALPGRRVCGRRRRHGVTPLPWSPNAATPATCPTPAGR